MSRIGILTFHSANNFGALLQAVSLQKTIIEHGGTECELINYEPEFIYKDYSISPFKSKHPKVIIKSILRIPDKIKRNSKFQSFREENTICSGQCQSEDSFEKTCNSFEYAKSWTVKKTKETSNSLEVTVHSKNRYQLAHLLEHGHAKRGGGRVSARPHIAKAEESSN